MEVLQYIQNKVNCILRQSNLGGVGFFAVRDIQVEEIMFQPWMGESGIYSITHDELVALPPILHKNIYETFSNKLSYIDKRGTEVSITKEYGKIFFPLERGYHWIYLWPKMFMNSGLNNGNVNSNDYVLPVVTKKIYKGKEVLGNYGSQFKSTPKNFI